MTLILALNLWKKFGIVSVLIVDSVFSSATLGGVGTFGPGGRTMNYFAEGVIVGKRLNGELRQRRRKRQLKKRCSG